MLVKRIATAAIGIPFSIFAINYGSWVYGITISFFAIVAWYEYSNMIPRDKGNPAFWTGALGIAFFLGCAWQGSPFETVAVITALTLVITARMVFAFHSFSLTDAALSLLGVVYVGFTFSHLLLLRYIDTAHAGLPAHSLPYGAVFIWIAFLGTWASDTFAYFVGSAWGRTKLCPDISPSKTREGAAGGLVGSVVTVIVFGSMYHIPLYHLVALGFVVGIAAPVGDLVESAIKRAAGVKDSGRFFPGHGGVLDRFDSIMFAVPAVYYYVQLIVSR